MNITVLAIGKKHDPRLQAANEDYTRRLGHYVRLRWNLVEAKVTSSMSPEQIRQVESDTLAHHITEGNIVILLDETGSQLTSLDLSQKLQHYMNTATKEIIFVVGGAYGVDEKLMKRADFVWSLSKLVFPHQLVRLILVEQLYRAHTILAGEKYHHI